MAFVPVKFAILRSVDEAVDCTPPKNEVSPVKALVPEAKTPPVVESVRAFTP